MQPSSTSPAPAALPKMGLPVPPSAWGSWTLLLPEGTHHPDKNSPPSPQPPVLHPPGSARLAKSSQDLGTSLRTVALSTEAAGHRQEGLALTLPPARVMPSMSPRTPHPLPWYE